MVPEPNRSDCDTLPAGAWAYAVVGAIQVAAMMWLRDGYGDPNDIADHLTQLMWPGLMWPGLMWPGLAGSDDR